MVVVEPLILLEVDEAGLGLDSALEAPESILVDEQVHLSVCCRIHGVGHENSWDVLIVPLLAE